MGLEGIRVRKRININISIMLLFRDVMAKASEDNFILPLGLI